MTIRRIAVVTGSRADWSHLAGLHDALASDGRFDTRLVVTGSHLSADHGSTISEILSTDRHVACQIPIPADAAAGCAAVIAGLSTYLVAENVDLVVLLGDRYEILGAAIAALLTDKAIAHIHGGETTAGAFDEQIRHAISKMATVHFVAAEPYRKRLIAMGEDPSRIYVFGPPIHDVIHHHAMTPLERIELAVGRTLERPLVSLTYQPVTRGTDASEVELNAILAALDRHPDVRVVVSGVNADPGGETVSALLKAWVETNQARAIMVASLGFSLYASLLHHCDAMIGNSSSGYIEGAAIGLPVIDVGDRQAGRLRSANINHVPADMQAIDDALTAALAGPSRLHRDSVYGRGPFVSAAVEVLATLNVDRAALRKPFYDILPLEAA